MSLYRIRGQAAQFFGLGSGGGADQLHRPAKTKILKGVSKPVILVLNKVDLLPDKSVLFDRISAWSALYPFLPTC